MAEIDQLSIKIKTDSSGAAAGIDALVGSLEKLKKIGSFGKAVTNLNNLAGALRNISGVSSATRTLGALAGALERIKGVGTLGPLAKSIPALSTGLNKLGSLNIEKLAPKIEGVADAVRPLSQVKAGGINTMANGLLKLDKVTKSLDDDTIKRFADRIQKLLDKLTPLSEKLTTIQSGLRAVNTNARSAGRAVQSMGNDVNTTALNMASFVTIAQGVVQALEPVVRVIGEATYAAAEWDGIAARFGRGFGENAQETYDWIMRLNEEMGINVQQFMQYSSVYATMLTGFGVAMEDAGKMALGYTELTYDIWAGYNDIYKNFDDAAEAVKSAIAGEVEPIRRAGFTIVESTLEQTAANYGLDISLEKATESQKSYLRYLTLIDQAHAQSLVGTYAKEMNTAEGLLRTFAQQVKSLAQAFGSLFLPVLVAVMPWLQAFVSLLTDAIRAVAAFFGIEIQAVDWSGYNAGSDAIGGVAESAEDAGGALGSAAKAAKELKNATLGIDELNVISPPDPNSGRGGGGGAAGGGTGFDGLDVDSLWDESIFNGIQNQVEELKDRLMDFLPVVGGIAAAFAGWRILNLLDNLDDADVKLGKFKGTIEGLAKGLAVAGITVAVGKLVWDFTGAYLEGGKVSDLLKAIGTTILGAGLAAWLAGPVGAGIVLLASGVIMLTRLGIEISEGSVEITDPQALTTAIIGTLETALGGAVVIDALRGGPWAKAIGTAISDGLMKAFGGTSFSWIATSIGAKLSTALAGVGTFLAGLSGWAIAAIAAIAAALVLAIVDYDFTDIGYKIGNGLAKALRSVGVWITEIGSAIKDGLETAINWVVEKLEIDSVWDAVFYLLNPAALLGRLLPDIIEIGWDLISGLFQGIGDALKNLWGNITEFIDGFLQGWRDGFEVNSPSKIFIELGEFLVAGLWQGIKDSFNGILKNCQEWIEDLLSGITTKMSPSAIKDKLSTMWTNAKNWWDKSKSKLSDYTPTIGSIQKKLETAWSSAKTWYDGKKAKLKEYTPTIGSIYEKLKVRWDNAREWYNNKKSKLKEYTPSIGSIYEKVKERWDNARTWYNSKKAGMSTYTPSIGSIKDKLVSAWNTAKSWWSKNVKLSIPSLGFKVTYSTPSGSVSKAIVKALGLSGWPKLSFAASGGIFDVGSMIWAGERGPEIVANAAGGKTGVMNVQQMQDAVYEGVYAAVVSAMSRSSGGGAQAVNVYLDGRQITASVEQTQRGRGATIMGKQVFAF